MTLNLKSASSQVCRRKREVLVEEAVFVQLPGAASEFQGNASGGKAAGLLCQAIGAAHARHAVRLADGLLQPGISLRRIGKDRQLLPQNISDLPGQAHVRMIGRTGHRQGRPDPVGQKMRQDRAAVDAACDRTAHGKSLRCPADPLHQRRHGLLARLQLLQRGSSLERVSMPVSRTT